MSKSDNLGDFLLDLKTTIQAKTGTSGTLNPQDFSTQIASIPSGDPAPKKYFFYDYDGTLLYSYTRAELEALSALPPVPTTHTQFSSGEWNWTLQDLKDYTDAQIVGATYTPVDGKTVIGISLRNANELTVTCLLDGERDWGDGTTDSNTSHTYATIGNYEIKITGWSQTTSTQYPFGQTSSAPNSTVKYIYYNKVNICGYAFQYCSALEKISLSEKTVFFPSYSFSYSALKFVAFPKTLTTYTNSNLFLNCYQLERCSFPKTITDFGSNGFTSSGIVEFTAHNFMTGVNTYAFNNCKKLRWFHFAKTITSISQGAFSSCVSLDDISSLGECNLTMIGTNAFESCSSLTIFDIGKSSNLNSIGNYALQYANNLEIIILPKALSLGGGTVTWYALRKVIIKSGTAGFGISNSDNLISFEGVFDADGNPYPLNGYQRLSHSKIRKAVIASGATDYGSNYAFAYSTIEEVTHNGSPTSIAQNCFQRTLLSEFTMKNTVTTINSTAFSESKVRKIVMSSALTTISASAFNGCSECLLFDFSNCGQVPSLSNTNAFNSTNVKKMIVVPDSLYETWIGSTNWSSLSSYIYKASEVNI